MVFLLIYILRCGSLFTMAPEVILGVPHGIKADIYSLGVIFY